MYPVAFMECVFKEIKPCSNPEYFLAIFNFNQEAFGRVFPVAEQPQPRNTSILCNSKEKSSLLNLVPGKKYGITVSLRVNKGGEKDGKVYSPSVGYNIINAKEIA